ncbi:hypothetical protein VPH35_031751 [Triticum aestivum]
MFIRRRFHFPPAVRHRQQQWARHAVYPMANNLPGWCTIRPYAAGVSPRATLPELRLTDESSTFRAKLDTQTPANVMTDELILNKNHTKKSEQC